MPPISPPPARPADQGTLDNLRHHYGLDRPLYVQYLTWVGNALQGDLGVSFEYRAPVADIIWSRLGMTFLVASCTLLFVWAVAFPIGIYSALRQYKIGDYIVTFLGFVGMATPNFLLALFVMYVSVVYMGYSVGGLFSPGFRQCALELRPPRSISCITSGSRWWCWGWPASPP